MTSSSGHGPTPIRPAIPPGQRVYAIGDIHGRADLLDTLLRMIADDMQVNTTPALIVTLGDYIDRGPDSAAVLHRLAEGPLPAPLVPLMGNHEEMLLEFMAEPGTLRGWRHNGALEALRSFGVDTSGAEHGDDFASLHAQFMALAPPHILDFVHSLSASLHLGDYFFCHAGVRPGVPLANQAPHDLLWIRQAFLQSTEDFGAFVVHGHTPVDEPEIRPNRIDIDTRAFSSGRLTALVLEGPERWFLTTGSGTAQMRDGVPARPAIGMTASAL